jgi:predicted ATPase/class 3 adenylate cyclase
VPELPTGTVTFLFTDIEGSTVLLHTFGDRYAEVLAEHRQLLREAFERRNGVEVDTQGDAFFVAFARASDALTAAAEAQKALAGGPVRVRIGIHTGEPLVTQEGYVGPDVHRAARIASAAHGGQVLFSQTTRDLHDAWSQVRDLGDHRLKDLSEPLHLYQLGHDEFPPPKTLSRTNLPVQPTSLIGRERELEQVTALVSQEDVRLVTLTGPGGAGKTRVGLHVGAELVEEFSSGVFFVALAPIREPGLVLSTIAKSLGLREVPDEALDETLERYLTDKQLLLLIDNFERLLDAAPAVVALLRQAPRLKLLVTSREPLHVTGEHEYAVPPLSSGDALALFSERAQGVRADFRLTADNAAAISEICDRVDGLPLAIELAAARAKLLPLQALRARLEERLPLLTGGPRDAPARQRTLRATIEWSYDLLDESDQALFCRLGAFVGGCTFDTAEEVCAATFDGLSSLVDKSLLRNVEGSTCEPRVSMLQTVREYAVEQLDESGEADELRRRHAEHFRELAERSEPEILRSDQILWLDRLHDELDNFRAALEWSLARGELELALRLIGSLRRAWVARGYLAETRWWLQTVLDQSNGVGERVKAKALYGLGRVALVQGDYEHAISQLEQSAALFRGVGDSEGLVYSLADLGWIETARGNHERARALAEEGVTVARGSGDETSIAAAVHSLGCAALEQGDYARAKNLFQESLAVRRSLGDKRNVASSLGYLGVVALLMDDHDAAATALQESLALGRELDNLLIVSTALAHLGIASLFQCDAERAAALAAESLELCRDLGDKRTVIECLHALAGVAASEKRIARATTLSGAADALHEDIHAPPSPAERIIGEQFLGLTRAGLSEDELGAAWSRGRTMSVEEAVDYALAAKGNQPGTSPSENIQSPQ